MFAIIKTGGKQYRVAVGNVLRVEKLDVETGQTVELTDVLAVGENENVKFGSPFVAGAKVVAEVVDQMRDKKVLIFKKVRRHNHRRKNGHRQHLSVLKIKEIVQN